MKTFYGGDLSLNVMRCDDDDDQSMIVLMSFYQHRHVKLNKVINKILLYDKN